MELNEMMDMGALIGEAAADFALDLTEPYDLTTKSGNFLLIYRPTGEVVATFTEQTISLHQILSELTKHDMTLINDH